MYSVFVFLVFAVPIVGFVVLFLPRVHLFFRTVLPLTALLWLVDLYLYSDAAAFDCWPGCSTWQRFLGGLLVVLPLLFVLAFVALLVVTRMSRMAEPASADESRPDLPTE